jgi:DNA adenine methylase
MVSERISQADPRLTSTLKWVGGKRKLAQEIVSAFPAQFGTYFEPFLGGASVFLEAAPARAKLSDLNASLINYYLQLRDNLSELLDNCRDLESTYNSLSDQNARKDLFLAIRNSFNQDELKLGVGNASQFLFLNKTGFNGMYRENSKGQFNIPFNNSVKLRLLEEDQFRLNSEALQNASLSVSDYRETVSAAVAGDLVYFDPPYVPISLTSAFVDYTKSSFGPSAQEELRDTAQELVGRGVSVVLSNSHCETVEKLYNGFEMKTVDVTRLIAAKGKFRGKILEYVILGLPKS